ncbi:hypothetical protein EXIGLDRAFT_829491 [Exidia glandulosa HHB12029]|uniref:Uncharacterized protein n=1 Tax=Exidia glandulosa HHB12029 TaxID=1314781 RepID=A0A165PKF9_EXIGL|nr:hypothetical protein EXIGLDRAFT_829491 [Exidia glandulosa HHB12029]
MVVISSDNDGGKRQAQTQPLLAQQNQAPPPQYTPGAAPGPSRTYWPAPGVFVQQRRESAVKRFLKAFLVALLVWFLLGALVQSITQWGFRRIRSDFVPTNPRPEDGHVVECYTHDSSRTSSLNSSLQRSYHASYEFKLPFDSETGYYLLTRGKTGVGSVQLTDDHAGDDMLVTIDVEYNDKDLFSENRICLLDHSSPKERGIGIYSPDWSGPHFPFDKLLRFTVVYNIPSKAPPTFVKSFSTYTANYGHQINLPDDTVFFESVNLRGSNAAIRASSLSSSDIKLRTSNAGIAGHFVSNGSIALDTSNGSIDADVQLTGVGSSKSPARLSLRTSNAKIVGRASLEWDASGKKSAVQGVFSVSATTSNGPINYSIAKAPVDSQLLLTARTSNSNAQVQLSPIFEGDVLLRNSNAAQPALEITGPVRDPKNKGRSYDWVRDNSKNRREWRGKVGWDVKKNDDEHRPEHWGNVEVVTSNGRCGLSVDHTLV